jgi:uncharacterized membrane protein YfcA
MGLKLYLPVSVLVFLTATIASDVIALTSIGGEPFEAALREHLYWARVEILGTALLMAPFVAVAFISSLGERRAGKRATALIFAVAMLALLYFYFQGYQAAERAAEARKWTGATLSIALLPFFVGLPVAIGTWIAQAATAKSSRRSSE